MKKIICLIIAVLTMAQTSAAEQCSAIFPDGASTQGAGGNISFGFNARLIGSNDNLLATTAITQNGGSNIDTCNTTDCVATGTPSVEASSVSFQTTASTADVILGFRDSVVVGSGSFSGNEFDDINPNFASEASITFSSTQSEYFVDNLVLAFDNVVYLQAGSTYWINRLVLSSQAEIIVQGTGTAIIYVNQSLSFPSPGLINSPSINNSGDASKLVIYGFSDVSFSNNSTFTGSLYAQGNVTLGSSSYAFGAVSAANIQLGTESTINYQSTEIAETDFGNICDSTLSVVEPILDYRFDECSYTGVAGDVIDQIGNFDGSSNGVSPTTNSAIVNKSLDLSANNTSDWVDVPSSVVDGLDDFSVSVWFKTSVSKSQQQIFHALGNNTNDDELEIFLRNSNTVYIKVRDNSEELTSNVALTDGDWHHLVITRVDEDVCLFIDGTEQECDDGVNSGVLSVNNANAIVIGQEQDSFGGSFTSEQSYVGLLDEFKVYSSQLSDTDITAIYDYEFAGKNFNGVERASVTCSQVTIQYCATFTDGATANGSGELQFKGSPIIHNGFDNVLAAENAKDLSKATCDGFAECEITGVGTTELNLGVFLKSSSGSKAAKKVEGPKTIGGSSDNYPGSQFEKIDIKEGAVLSFSAEVSEYRIEKLKIKSATLNLTPGDYYIGKMGAKGNTIINIIGSGNIRIFLEDNSKFEDNTLINLNGEPEQLLIYSYEKVEIKDTSQIKALIYSQDEIKLKDDAILTGAASAGSKLKMEDDAQIYYSCADTAPSVNHYRIEHDGQGFTCEAESIVIKACINSDCDLYDQETIVTLSPNGWVGGNTPPAFTGSTSVNLSYTTAETVTLGISSALPSAPVKCFQAGIEEALCNLEFVDAGFEFIGATINDKILPDQVAETNFENVNLRAVQKSTMSDPAPLACEPAIIESRMVTFGYACDEPEACLTPLIVKSAESIASPGSGEGTKLVDLNFNAEGIASLTDLNYADAGRLMLSATATLNGGTILRGTGNVDVIPASLRLSVTDTNLPYTDSDDKYVYRAGAAFEYTIGAYGSAGKLLPNYQPQKLQFQVIRDYPTETDSVEGNFNSGIGNISSEVNNSQLPEPAFNDVTEPTFNDGQYANSEAYYSETGRISLDVRDANYLDNQIDSQGDLSLGTFIPAYYQVNSNTAPKLIDACGEPINPGDPDGFSYLGQNIEVSVAAEIQIAAKNAQGLVTRNFNSSDDWAWLSSRATAANIEWVDKNVSIDVDFSGTPDIDIDSITGSQGQGQRLLSISNMQIAYEKGSSPIEPFSGVLNMHFLPGFFTDMTYASDPGGASICLQMKYAPANVCNTKTSFSLLSDFNNVFTIPDIGAAELRWGRLILENTYGPENEDLLLGVSTEYFSNNRFERNIDDNCTTHNFTQPNFKRFDKSNNAETTAISILDSSYTLISGQTYGIGGIEVRNNDSIIGEYRIELQPIGDATITWDDYLQFDWNGAASGFGNPSATVTFGQFRGNDRIIHWREVFN
jgi:MSHA biogenesis protein MshQ